MTKDAYYFSHDANAHKDPKILKLRSKHGWEGYGIYWAIIETLREQNEYKWLADDKQLLTFSFSNGDETVNQVLDDCLNIGLLDIDDDGYIHSESLTRRMKMKEEIADKRREAGRKGGQKSKRQAKDKQMPKQTPSKESKGKESKRNEYTPEFESFWKEYPKKIEKKQAFKSFKTAIKNNSLDEIINGTKGYAQQIKNDGTESRFIKHASTFLNNDSFKEYLNVKSQQQSNPYDQEIDPETEELERKLAELHRG